MKIEKKHIINGGFLVVAVAGANFLNFLFNAMLGRWLSFEDFGLITLVVTFYSVSGIFTNALAGIINFTVSKYAGAGEESKQLPFLKITMQKSTKFLLMAVMLWILSMPLLKNIFHLETYLPLLAFIPVLIFSVYSYPVIGYFQGKLAFLFAGILIISEAAIKLLFGILFSNLGIGNYSYFSIPLSLLVIMLIGFILLHFRNNPSNTKKKSSYVFPSRYYLTTVAIGIGSILFFSIDIFLVRHFFSAEMSGQYALVSLIGKMVFFLSILPNMFTLPVVARTTERKKIRKLFSILISTTALLALIGWMGLGVFGYVVVPVLFGEKASAILHLLPIYTMGVGMYVLSSVIVSFHLAQQHYAFSYPLITAGVVVGILIGVRHQNLQQITTNISFACGLLLGFLLVMHIIDDKRRVAYVNKLE